MTIPTKLNKGAKSEFGKGLVICLVKFAEHMEAWRRFKEEYAELSEGMAVQRWFNGASDHLYEIEIPNKWSEGSIGQKVRELQAFALDIGHGIGLMRDDLSEEDVIRAADMCREIALLIDQELGLKPDIGQW